MGGKNYYRARYILRRENAWRMYFHAEMTRDKGKKCPMINGPMTHDKWTNDP